MRKRVAITGLGAVSPYGAGMDALIGGLEKGLCAIGDIPQEIRIANVNCHCAGLVPPLRHNIARETRRCMSPMSIFAFLSAREALAQAGLEGEKNIGVYMGSTMGSGQELQAIFDELARSGNVDQVRTMSFFKIMGHTAASGVAQALGLCGRVINPVAACAASLQGIGLAFEAIAEGREEQCLCGGAEEYSFLASATFDKIGAASACASPRECSRPFDLRRSGVVCGEGAAVLCLEEMEKARARGARILGEVKSFATLSSPASLASPDAETAARCMAAAMAEAGIGAADLALANAHATATIAGDRAEGNALAGLFGDSLPVNALKGYLGHAMAASGALETAVCVDMLLKGRLIGMPEGFEPDSQCGNLRFAQTGERPRGNFIIKNSFALGGIFASLVIGGPQ